MMRKAIGIFFLALASAAMAQNAVLLKKAEEAYDHKRYKEAISAYEQLLGEGYKSWKLHYNIGNAYYRNDELGKAIWHYELARKLNPDDDDVKVNLGIAASKTIDRIDSRENFFISAVKTNVLSTFSTRSWAWLSIVFVFLAAIFFLVFTFATSVTFKRFLFVSGILSALLFLVSYGLGYSALRSRYENKFAIILSREVKIMNEPTPSANSKFSLHEGTRVRIVESNGDWMLIKLENGNEGWLRNADIGVI
jgi:tetratricopeptide (TPR) repeat protein